MRRGGIGRRRLYCGPACRQHAYRLREDARRGRAGDQQAAGPDEVARLLNAALQVPTRR